MGITLASLPQLSNPYDHAALMRETFGRRRVLCVDNSMTGLFSDGNKGDSWLRPLSTVEGAFSHGDADTDMIVLTGPLHAQTIAAASAASGIDADVAGATIWGLGNKNRRPTFTMATATTADVDVDAANVTWKNLRFITDVASLAALVDVNAAGFTMEDCDFYGNNAVDEIPAITVITDAAANHMRISRCNFYGLAAFDGTVITSTATEIIRLVGADHAIIEDCYMSGTVTTALINGVTTASNEIIIQRNMLVNDQTTNIAGWIDLVAACTGVIRYNEGFHGYTIDIATVIDPSSCAMIENYVSNVVTEAGGIIGTRST
mgnify:CR=1 FL=1